MVSHRLRINLGITRDCRAKRRKPAARIFAEIQGKLRIDRQPVAAFVCRHSVAGKQIARNPHMPCRQAVHAALMRHTGIVNLIKNTIFDACVLADIPKFHGVSEADLPLRAPHAAADKTKPAAEKLRPDSLAGYAVNAAHLK